MSTAQSFVDYLSPDAIGWISAQGARCAVESGSVLVSEGTKPGCIFLVMEGAFEVNISGAGAVIGEMSWLDGGPASATIEAMGPCEVLSIEESALDEKVASDPVFGASFYRALAHEAFVRLRAGNARLGNAYQAPITNRGIRAAFLATVRAGPVTLWAPRVYGPGPSAQPARVVHLRAPDNNAR